MYKSGIELYPVDYSLLQGVCVSYGELEDFKLSIKHGLIAEQFAPSDRLELTHHALNNSFLHDKNYSESIRYGHLLIEKNPNDAENIMALGRSFLFGPDRNLTEARKYLDKSLKKVKSCYCYGNLGHLELISGNNDAALEQYFASAKKFDSIDEFAKSISLDEHLMIDSGIDIKSYKSITDEAVERVKKSEAV